jgi:hypothetical protein
MIHSIGQHWVDYTILITSISYLLISRSKVSLLRLIIFLLAAIKFGVFFMMRSPLTPMSDFLAFGVIRRDLFRLKKLNILLIWLNIGWLCAHPLRRTIIISISRGIIRDDINFITTVMIIPPPHMFPVLWLIIIIIFLCNSAHSTVCSYFKVRFRANYLTQSLLIWTFWAWFLGFWRAMRCAPYFSNLINF